MIYPLKWVWLSVSLVDLIWKVYYHIIMITKVTLLCDNQQKTKKTNYDLEQPNDEFLSTNVLPKAAKLI